MSRKIKLLGDMTRRFGAGKRTVPTFWVDSVHNNKTDANHRAEVLRRQGYLARITRNSTHRVLVWSGPRRRGIRAFGNSGWR